MAMKFKIVYWRITHELTDKKEEEETFETWEQVGHHCDHLGDWMCDGYVQVLSVTKID